MRIKFKRKIPVISFLFIVLLAGLTMVSCKDDYIYDDEEPDFLGASIYDYMEQDGQFTYFLRLINDLDYKDVLSKTGSKTLFPVKDDAFERFFQGNVYGVRSYDDFTSAQKRLIMNASMVNMAYLSYMLSNTSGSGSSGMGEGMAIRRNVTNTYLDSISYVKDEVLFANPYWKRFQSKGLYLVDNESSAMITHFTPQNMAVLGVNTEDFSIFYNGKAYDNDIYVNGIKIIQKDIICKNGYIHILEDLVIPSKNMAQIIRDNGETSLFNKLLNKFCLPYYNESISRNVHAFYNGSSPYRPMISPSDSIYVKRYFTESFNQDEKGNSLVNYGLLYFDPTDNAYPGSSQQDMGAMFVPTDQAMNEYINSGKGRYLKDAYGSWDNVPTPILVLFLKNHQKKSFMSSLPHIWPTMTDETSAQMNVSASDIKKTYMATNGAVYISNNVYPPIDYQCVYASVMTSVSTQIMNWGIQNKDMKFYLYLRSMENMYNLIVPIDEAFQNYRDPVSWAKGGISREIWSFRYVPEKNMIYADRYHVNEAGEKGAFIGTYSDRDQSIIRNRLNDIIDMHIVVGEKVNEQMSGYIDDGNTQYTQTKSGATLKISGSGDNTKMIGGGDLEVKVSPAEIVTNPSSGQKNRYDSYNGRTYFIDKILQDPTKSVYTLLGEHSEYAAFFDLLKGDDRVFSYFENDKSIVPIFNLKRLSSSSGLGFVVNSFNNFRYTVFVPTEEALNKAFAEDDKLFTWEEIADDIDHDSKKAKTIYLLNFLKNHFMDNSIFIDGKPFSGMNYETASPNLTGKFRKLILNSSGSDMRVQSETMPSSVANVIKTAGLYNLMGRDYIVNSGDYMKATEIVSSSRSAIHLIDKALRFE